VKENSHLRVMPSGFFSVWGLKTKSDKQLINMNVQCCHW